VKTINTKWILHIFFLGFIPWLTGCHKSLENPDDSANYVKLIDVFTSKPIVGASMHYITCEGSGEYGPCSNYGQSRLVGKTDSNGLIKNINGPGEIFFTHPDYLDYHYGLEGLYYNCKNQNSDFGFLPPRTYALYPSTDIKYIIHGSDEYSNTDYFTIEARSFFEIGKNPNTGEVTYCSKNAALGYFTSNRFPLTYDIILWCKSVADKEVKLRITYYIAGSSFFNEYKFFTPKGQETVVEIPAP
jgi:hypothetical protein